MQETFVMTKARIRQGLGREFEMQCTVKEKSKADHRLTLLELILSHGLLSSSAVADGLKTSLKMSVSESSRVLE